MEQKASGGGDDSRSLLARYASMSAEELFAELAGSGRCSALVKVSPDLSNLFMSHSTWDTYTAMLRVYKHYRLDLHSSHVSSRAISFSSYPGELFSDDDFYLMDSNLVVLQTTNKIFNASLFDLLTPQSVVSWQRVRAANLLASSGREWAAVLDMWNSGTYNNQYMVVDLKQFVPRKELKADLLWVVEQIPGMVKAADVTHALWLGYWPSFNVPYFEEIYSRSAYPDFTNATAARGQLYGEPAAWLSQVASPRAMMFRRDQGRVESLEDMKGLMRYNDYTRDKLSGGHPLAAVCGRGDLAHSHALPKGCFDTKVTDYHMALRLEAHAVNGPPTSHGLPPFEWAERWAGFAHAGQPQRFDFDFEVMAPSLSSAECYLAAGAEGQRAARAVA